MKRFGRYARPLFGAALFLIALRIVFHELQHFRYHEASAYLGALPLARVLIALAATIVSYAALASYDVLAIRTTRGALPLRKTVFASFVSAAVSNTVGLSGLAGGTLRYRLYTAWGLEAGETARVIAFAAGTFWLGFLTLGGVVLTVDPLVLPRWIGPSLLVIPIAYGAARASKLAAQQIAVSTIDWLAAGIAFAALLPRDVNVMTALAVFLAAQIVGAISNLPAGIGVFEAAVFSLLRGSNANALAGGIVAYRAIYYLLPLLAAGVLVAVQAVVRRRAQIMAIASLFVPAIFSLALFIDGVVLLVSGATPAAAARVTILRTTIPLPLVELAHLVGSMAGAGLLLLARGVQRRLNGAWMLSITLLGAGIVASLFKGLDYEEAALLAITIAVLAPCRREFYRRTALLDEPFTPGWIVAIALAIASTLWLGLFAYRRIEYSPSLWWHFSFAGDAPRFLRATLAVAAIALAFSVRKLLRMNPAEAPKTTAADLADAESIARATPAPNGYLVLLGDKSILLNDAKNAFLMYGVQGRSWIAMGDPIGPPDEARALAWRFFEEADRHNAWPVFYQIRTANLPLYIELGLHLVKLGEEARVRVAGFSLSGGDRKSLRHSVKRLEADGVKLEIVPREDVPRILPELRRISNDWLAARQTREKRFSLGSFDEHYLAQFPMAVVCSGGKIVAFANLWGDDAHHELTVDLMRHAADAPPGVMDFLFTHLIFHAQAHGYTWFNLGMAPLSGLEARAQGPLWGRVAALGVAHGGRFYNFQGLRRFKGKFDPVWEPVFLASPGGLKLPRILTDVAARTSGGMRGIVMR